MNRIRESEKEGKEREEKIREKAKVIYKKERKEILFIKKN